MIAYVVMSQSGEYESYSSVPIAVFTGRSASKQSAAFANACRAYMETRPTPEDEEADDDAWERNYDALNAWKAAHPYYKSFDLDTTYRVLSINLNPRVNAPSTPATEGAPKP